MTEEISVNGKIKWGFWCCGFFWSDMDKSWYWKDSDGEWRYWSMNRQEEIKEEPTDEDIEALIEVLDNADVPTEHRLLWFEGEWYGN